VSYLSRHVSTQDAVMLLHVVCFHRWHRWTALGHVTQQPDWQVSWHLSDVLSHMILHCSADISTGCNVAVPLQPGIHAPVTVVTGTGFFVLPQGGWHDKRSMSSASGFAVLFPFSFSSHTHCLCWVVKWQ